MLLHAMQALYPTSETLPGASCGSGFEAYLCALSPSPPVLAALLIAWAHLRSAPPVYTHFMRAKVVAVGHQFARYVMM